MYTTICDVEKYDYSIEDGHESLIDQNHEALDLYQKHYHLLTTKIFDIAINESLFKLFKLMHYIIKYEECLYNEFERLNRWVGDLDYTRKYAPCFSGNVSSVVNKLFSDITRKRLLTTTELILKIEEDELK